VSPADLEASLDGFRAWWREAAARGQLAEPPAPEAEPIDLHTLLAQFTALRHEVHLQTRAARAQQEQGAQALGELSDALELLREQARAAPAPLDGAVDTEEAIRPLLKTLVETYDALALAEREVKRVQELVEAEAREPAASPAPISQPEPEPVALAEPPAAPSLGRLVGIDRLARWLHDVLSALARKLAEGRPTPSVAVPPAPVPSTTERVRQLLGSVAAGYTMSLQRVERALRQHGLEPIDTVGQPFDPERMEVLEVVPDSGRPSGEVVGEVRRGYLRHGRVFRYAQVRVARS
jgi:molecular chaperone GrpE